MEHSQSYEDSLDDEGPGGQDAHLLDDDIELAPCPSCGKMLNAISTSCHHCETDFAGKEAWQVEAGDIISRKRGIYLLTVLGVIASICYVIFRLGNR